MKIRFAVTPPACALDEAHYPRYLEECENLGFDTIWLSDIPLGGSGDPLVSLCFAAAHTKRLKLGANLVPLGRHPLWFAKQLAQLDRLSNGRLLVSFVPGLGTPAERLALGYKGKNRSTAIDEMIELMRRWWAGETVSTVWENLTFDNVALEPTPLQEPLEVWLGGASEAALERVAKLSDGWLTSAITPLEAAQSRRKIQKRADELGRTVDSEHFGISMPFSVGEPDQGMRDALRKRRKDGDLSEIIAVGSDGLRELVEGHLNAGLSKFVMRPVDKTTAEFSWRDNLHWLADIVLPLQT